MLNWIIDFSLRHRFAGDRGGAGAGRRWGRVAALPGYRRLPRHHAGAGADQHRRAGAWPGGSRAADHVSDRAGASAACRAWRSCGRSRSSACRRSSSRSRTAPTSTSPGSWSTSGWRRVELPAGHRAARRWGRSPPAWARCFTTSSPRGLRLRHDAEDERSRSSPSCARSTTGSSSPSCGRSPAWPRSTAGAATRSSTRCGSIPNRLIKHGLTFDEVVEAVQGEQPQRRRRQHRARQPDAAGAGPRPHRQRRPDQGHRHHGRRTACRSACGDVADVAIGPEIRRGAVTADGKGEVVLGLGFMLMGENSHEVTWAMKDRLDEIKPTLPPDVTIETGLRPHRAGRSRHRHRAQEPVRGRAAGHRRAVRSSWATCGRPSSWRWRFRCRCCSPSPACCGSASPPAC